MDLMAKNQTPVDGVVGVLYDTPLHQSINTLAYWSLKDADHSIYELTPAYATKVNDKTKSLHTLTAYTVKEWVDEAKGKKIEPAKRAPPVTATPADIREMLRNLANLFIGLTAEEVIATNPGLIPPGCTEAFKEIMAEVNAA